MFQVRVGSESLVYTGDYNMTPDRHLGAAWIGTIHILRKQKLGFFVKTKEFLFQLTFSCFSFKV